MNTTSAISLQAIIAARRSRFNPLRHVTPDKLARWIEDFEAGRLYDLALLLDALERRDDTLKTVKPKTTKAVARCNYDIVIMEGEENNPRAQEHKETLVRFYSRLVATSALCRNQRGGVPLLIRQMMDSYGQLYSCHEIVWKPRADFISAEMIHVPLWFFEASTGRLRFVTQPGSIEGADMPDGEWLVTVGEGVGPACAVAWQYKHLALSDWLLYCERCGIPGIFARTAAKKDSPEWLDLVKAVEEFVAGWYGVGDKETDLDKIDLSATGTLPHPLLVERMDRAIAALWRGADLSTMSRGQGEGSGASVQGEETNLLDADNCALISETLNEQLDRYAILHNLGDETPLAYFRLTPPQQDTVERDIQIDEHLVKHGARLSMSDALSRYGRSEADPADRAMTAPTPVPAMPFHNANPDPVAAAVAATLAARDELINTVLDYLQAFADDGALSDAQLLDASEAVLRAMPELLTADHLLKPAQALNTLLTQALAEVGVTQTQENQP